MLVLHREQVLMSGLWLVVVLLWLMSHPWPIVLMSSRWCLVVLRGSLCMQRHLCSLLKCLGQVWDGCTSVESIYLDKSGSWSRAWKSTAARLLHCQLLLGTHLRPCVRAELADMHDAVPLKIG